MLRSAPVPKKNIFKRSYIDFYCGEELTLSSSSYFSEYLKLESSVADSLLFKHWQMRNSYSCQRSGWKLHFVCRAIHCWPQAAQSSLTSNEILPQACVQTSAQAAAAASWHTEPQSSGIRLTRRQGEALCVCVSHTHMLWRHWCICIILCHCVFVSQQVKTRPSAPVFILKDKLNPQSTFIKTGSEKVVICLSKYKHGRNNERSLISLGNPGLLMARHCGGLHVWTGGPVKRWQLEFCFLLCAEAVFAEWDKTWFLWQGKGKLDMLYISNCVHVCLSAVIHSENFSICWSSKRIYGMVGKLILSTA